LKSSGGASEFASPQLKPVEGSAGRQGRAGRGFSQEGPCLENFKTHEKSQGIAGKIQRRHVERDKRIAKVVESQSELKAL